MIFICVGSREYQFDRLIKQIDVLAEKKIISDVFGQIGTTNYIPKNFKFKRFLSSDEFKYYQEKSDLIISHGGTGALIGALKKEKQVISVPRLKKYGEHTDNHQTQISNVLEEMGYLISVRDIEKLEEAYLQLKNSPLKKVFNRESNIMDIIIEFIESSQT